MSTSDDIDGLLAKLDAGDRSELAYRWLDRALREDLSALLHMAEQSARAQKLAELHPLDDAQALIDANMQIQEAIEQASQDWQARVGQADDQGWQQVLDALGPEQVGIWAAFLQFSQDIDELLDRWDQPDTAFQAALLGRAIKATLGQLRVGPEDSSAELIAAAIAREEQQRQRREVIALLPS